MKNKIQLFISLLLVILVTYLLFLFMQYLWHGFTSLKNEVAVAIIAASATAIVSVMSVLITKYWERQTNVMLELRKQKMPVYNEFLIFWFDTIKHVQKGTQKPEEETVDYFRKFSRELTLWGSDEVLKEFSNFRKLSSEGGGTTTGHLKMFIIFENMLYAIRKDTGHKNKNLKQGDLLALFINDIDQYLNKEKTV